jgi:DNA-binding transcriptional LysR family regulator
LRRKVTDLALCPLGLKQRAKRMHRHQPPPSNCGCGEAPCSYQLIKFRSPKPCCIIRLVNGACEAFREGNGAINRRSPKLAYLYATLQLPGALHVNSAQTYEAAALAGLGLIQAPLLGIGRYLESGALVEVIPDFRRRALAVSLVVAHRSNLSRRVRAFMKWIEDVLTPYLE